MFEHYTVRQNYTNSLAHRCETSTPIEYSHSVHDPLMLELGFDGGTDYYYVIINDKFKLEILEYYIELTPVNYFRIIRDALERYRCRNRYGKVIL